MIILALYLIIAFVYELVSVLVSAYVLLLAIDIEHFPAVSTNSENDYIITWSMGDIEPSNAESTRHRWVYPRFDIEFPIEIEKKIGDLMVTFTASKVDRRAGTVDPGSHWSRQAPVSTSASKPNCMAVAEWPKLYPKAVLHLFKGMGSDAQRQPVSYQNDCPLQSNGKCWPLVTNICAFIYDSRIVLHPNKSPTNG